MWAAAGFVLDWCEAGHNFLVCHCVVGGRAILSWGPRGTLEAATDVKSYFGCLPLSGGVGGDRSFGRLAKMCRVLHLHHDGFSSGTQGLFLHSCFSMSLCDPFFSLCLVHRVVWFFWLLCFWSPGCYFIVSPEVEHERWESWSKGKIAEFTGWIH